MRKPLQPGEPALKGFFSIFCITGGWHGQESLPIQRAPYFARTMDRPLPQSDAAPL
jgi:hypothetical protein